MTSNIGAAAILADDKKKAVNELQAHLNLKC